jgi:hypothetical protein
MPNCDESLQLRVIMTGKLWPANYDLQSILAFVPLKKECAKVARIYGG